MAALLALALGAAAALAGTASAAIDFRADWEDARTGESPPAPWEGFEYGGTFDGTPAPGAQLAIVAAPVRSGRRAARFTVGPGDRYGGSSGERALVRWIGSGEQDGDDVVYGWSTLFPPDWQQPPGWGLITEWHADGRFALAPIRLNAGGDSLTLALSTGECPTPYGCATQRNLPLLSTLSRGRWNDLVVRIRWRSGPTGRIQVWHRIEGQSGFALVLDLDGVPTLPWRAGEEPASIYLLHGLYRDAGPGTSTVYHDGFVRGDSVAEVMATFPSDTPAPPPERVVDPTCDTCVVDVTARADGVDVTAHVEGAGDDVDTAYAVVPVPATAAGGLVVRAAVSLVGDRSAAGSSTLLSLLDGDGRPVGELGVDALGFLELATPALDPGRAAGQVRTGARLDPAGGQRRVELAFTAAGELVLRVDGVVRGRLRPDRARPAAAVAWVAAGLLRHDGPAAAGAPAVALLRLRVEPDASPPATSEPDALPDPFEAGVVSCAACSLAADGPTLVARAPLGGGVASAIARDTAHEWAWPLSLRAELRIASEAQVGPATLLVVEDGAGRHVAELIVAPDGRLGVRSPAGGLADTALLAWTTASIPLDGGRSVSVELELAPGGWASLLLDGREALALDGLTGGSRERPLAIRAGILAGGAGDGQAEVRLDRLVVEAAS